MMKDKFKISALEADDAEIKTISEFHKQIVEDTRLKGDLIYFHPNFPSYLKKIVESSEGHHLFKLQKYNQLCGFAHCIIMETTVFLNNIFICKGFRDQGVGKYFLHQILVQVANKSINNFTLDVFYSNKKAFHWYKRMGLLEIDKTNWVEICANGSAINYKRNDLDFRKDNNGFDCFYSGKNKAATVVNTTLTINNLSYIDRLPLTQFNKILTKENSEEIPPRLNFCKIETSVRMQGDFNEVLESLDQ